MNLTYITIVLIKLKYVKLKQLKKSLKITQCAYVFNKYVSYNL